MHLFTGYLQTLTSWLHVHPHLALLITFLVSFTESLAVIGSLIPGSITMTAIGILAGSGILRIDLTFVAAILGAVAGDSASYTLGYACSDRLADIWPFRRYPKWLASGKEYFASHGGKSVLIGRFIGPLRSMIPVIAGMMRMNRWHFLLANIVSAIGWSLLYVMPGVLIGAASSELSAEGATKLFMLIISVLVMVWLTSLGVTKLIIRANVWLATKLHIIWSRFRHQTSLVWLFKLLTPMHEKNHYRTAMLSITWILCFLTSIFIIMMVTQDISVASINNPVYLFLQSLRTPTTDTLFIIISLIIKPLSLISLMIFIIVYAIYYRDWRLLGCWLSLGMLTTTLSLLLVFIIPIPTPVILLKSKASSLFPSVDLAIATALFSFLIFYINKHYRSIFTWVLQIILFVILVLAGIAALYLGDNWVTSVMAAYFIGLSTSLAHWIFYRRAEHTHQRTFLSVALLCLLLITTTTTSYLCCFSKLVQDHYLERQQYVLTHEAWWSHRGSTLPIYTTNRIGHRTGFFNIQYSGSIKTLQMALTNHGWKNQPNSFFNVLIRRAGGQDAAKKLPLMSQLYLNKKPVLIMTYSAGTGHQLVVIRLWRSNYSLQENRQPIWIGSILDPSLQTKIKTSANNHDKIQSDMLLATVLSAVEGFQTNIVPIAEQKTLPSSVAPKLLIISEPRA